MEGQKSEILMTLEITRKDGSKDKLNLIGTIEKENDDGRNTSDSNPERSN